MPSKNQSTKISSRFLRMTRYQRIKALADEMQRVYNDNVRTTVTAENVESLIATFKKLVETPSQATNHEFHTCTRSAASLLHNLPEALQQKVADKLFKVNREPAQIPKAQIKADENEAIVSFLLYFFYPRSAPPYPDDTVIRAGNPVRQGISYCNIQKLFCYHNIAGADASFLKNMDRERHRILFAEMLIDALYFFPEFVPGLINLLSKFSEDMQAYVLQSEDIKTLDVISVAVKYRPEFVEPLLEVAEKLNLEQQGKFFSHKTKSSTNSLMYATRDNPELVPSLLRRISQLDIDKQAEILTQVNDAQWNVLLLATKHQPQLVEPLLEVAGKLNLEQQGKFFSQKNKSSTNSLMFAIVKSPQEVPSLLRRISQLDIDKQAEILTQVNDGKDNVLLIATALQPQLVKPILEAMSLIPKESQARALTHINKAGYNTAKLALVSNSPAAPIIFEKIMELDGATITQILKNISPTNSTLFDITTDYCPHYDGLVIEATLRAKFKTLFYTTENSASLFAAPRARLRRGELNIVEQPVDSFSI